MCKMCVCVWNYKHENMYLYIILLYIISRCTCKIVARSYNIKDSIEIRQGNMWALRIGTDQRADSIGTDQRADSIGTDQRADSIGTDQRDDSIGTDLRDDSIIFVICGTKRK